MASLPLELVELILDNLPTSLDLRHFRLVSRNFKAAVTPRAFRILHVTAHDASLERFNYIHECDELRYHVQEVVFQYDGDALDNEDIESVADSATRAVKIRVVEDDEDDDGSEIDSNQASDVDSDENSGEMNLKKGGKEVVSVSTEGSEEGEWGVSEGSEVEGAVDATEDDYEGSGDEEDGWEHEENEWDDESEGDDEIELDAGLGFVTFEQWQKTWTTKTDIDNLNKRWPALFHLEGFTRLRAVHLSFYPVWSECRFPGEAYTPSRHFCLQKSVLAALANDTPLSTIKSLSLCNLIAADDGFYETPSFQAIIPSLESLSISTVGEEYTYGLDQELRHWNTNFWCSTMSSKFLSPAEANLTSLSLQSNEFVGAADDFDIHGYHFPRLVSLTLGHFVFGYATPDKFIIDHKHTLERLELKDCGMFCDVWLPHQPERWYTTWNIFRTELTHLKEVVVARTDYYDVTGRQGYIRLEDCWTYVDDDEYDSDGAELEDGHYWKEDWKAWVALRDAVDLRRLGPPKPQK